MDNPLDFNWAAERERIRSAAERLWQHPMLRFYTDHGVSHSERVYQICENLKFAWALSAEELEVLWTCAYIHDIGMQFSDWGSYRTKSGKTVARALGEKVSKDPLWIREHHCDLGLKLLTAELEGKRSWTMPPSFCSVTPGHPANFLWACSRIAFSHSKGSAWDDARSKPPKNYRHPDGKPLRTALLIGAFRIADELDGCKNRIRDMSRILHSTMPKTSVAHWLACWFVDELIVKADEEAIEVAVRWQVPTDASEAERAEIRELLKIFRRTRITRVADEVWTFFSQVGKDSLRRAFSVRGLDDDDAPEPVPFPDWQKLRPAVQRTLEAAGWRPPRRYDGGGTKGSGRLAAADVRDALKNWTLGGEGFRRGRHFILERGLHTDAFVNCRALGSDQDLVVGVCDWLDARVGEIDLCVAVGTSMIPFALEFARRRSSRFTFTCANPILRFGDTKMDRFAEIESAPLVPEACRGIVVLDDIIAVGEGARSVVTELQGAPGVEACRVWHYSLFRLGKQRFFRLPDVTYGWLCWIKDVHYWREGQCPVCAKSSLESPVREADVLT